MIIDFHRNFDKAYFKLSPKLQAKVDQAIHLFERDPFDPKLRNHALLGQMIGRRAFSVTGDVRVVFQVFENYAIVLMVDVGTHNQVY